MTIAVIRTEAELVAALSGRKRYLEYGVDGGDEYDEDGIGYAVMQGALAQGIVAFVDPVVARAWIDDGHDEGTPFYGPYCSTWHIPEHSGLRNDWVPCVGDIAVDDTVQWNEGVFDRSSGKPKYIGGLEVVGDVLREDGEGWIWLRVRECDVTADDVKDGRVRPLAQGVEIRRSRRTVDRDGQRLPRGSEKKPETATNTETGKLDLGYTVTVDHNKVVDGRVLAEELMRDAWKLLVPYAKACRACSVALFEAVANDVLDRMVEQEKVAGIMMCVSEADEEQKRRDFEAHAEATSARTKELLRKTEERRERSIHEGGDIG